MPETFLRGRKKPVLMTHMVLGHPSFEDNLRMLDAMSDAGAGIVELQFPFSEPIADGPVFVRANQASLERGTKVADCFSFMEKARRRFDAPLLMMGYYNTVFRMGEEAFCGRLKDAGGCGFILADLPAELGKELDGHAAKHDLAHIQIITPNTTPERRREIAALGSGFLYCVARKGVTGKRTDFGAGIRAYLDELRAVTALPLAVGFGVRCKEDVSALEGRADIVITGTAALEAYEKGGAPALAAFLKGLGPG